MIKAACPQVTASQHAYILALLLKVKLKEVSDRAECYHYNINQQRVQETCESFLTALSCLSPLCAAIYLILIWFSKISLQSKQLLVTDFNIKISLVSLPLTILFRLHDTVKYKLHPKMLPPSCQKKKEQKCTD